VFTSLSRGSRTLCNYKPLSKNSALLQHPDAALQIFTGLLARWTAAISRRKQGQKNVSEKYIWTSGEHEAKEKKLNRQWMLRLSGGKSYCIVVFGYWWYARWEEPDWWRSDTQWFMLSATVEERLQMADKHQRLRDRISGAPQSFLRQCCLKISNLLCVTCVTLWHTFWTCCVGISKTTAHVFDYNYESWLQLKCPSKMHNRWGTLSIFSCTVLL